MSGHTPGPWKVERVDDGEHEVLGITSNDGTNVIAEVWESRDAPVLAKAPEMYGALREVVVNYDAGILTAVHKDDRGNLQRDIDAARRILADVEGT